MLFHESRLPGKSFGRLYDIVDRVYPSWNPGKRYRSFITEKEPISDDKIALWTAISEKIPTTSIVLTTPLHRPLFENSGIKKVHTYDISIPQLEEHAENNKNDDSGSTIWWCDIFDPRMLRVILRESHPDVLYLSNILEYQLDESVVTVLTNVLFDYGQLKHILFSSVIGMYNELPGTIRLRETLEQRGWQITTYAGQYGHKIHVATKS